MNLKYLYFCIKLVSAEGSSISDGNSQCTESDIRVPTERQAGIGDSRPPSFQ